MYSGIISNSFSFVKRNLKSAIAIVLMLMLINYLATMVISYSINKNMGIEENGVKIGAQNFAITSFSFDYDSTSTIIGEGTEFEFDTINKQKDEIKAEAEFKINMYVGLVNVILSPLLAVIMLVFLKGVREDKIQFSNFADIIKNGKFVFKLIGLLIMNAIFIFLWSLLLVIPGIIKMFSYSQSIYILFDNPEKGILQCITESREMMDGKKLNLFGILILFFLVTMLIVIPIVILIAVFSYFTYSDVSNTGSFDTVGIVIISLITIITLIIDSFFMAVQYTIFAKFYEITKNEVE